MSIKSINPINGKIVKEYTGDSETIVSAKIEKGNKAWEKWKKTSFEERAKLLQNTAKILRERKEKLAVLMAEEMGKPLKEGISEIEKCALVCEY
ncbi:MAG: aldehyde dehydrogenase family protein, partial [Ginsengibacter sp.]